MTLSIPYARNIRTALLPALVLATMVTTGCATVASNQSSSTSQQAANPDGPNVSTVLESPESHQKSSVRWGGTVVAVENRENATWIEVVERPLNREGRPVDSRLSNGRFLAIVPEFLDPADYRSGRAITVSGSIDGSDTRKIGDAAYDYPKVVVADHQLWTTGSQQIFNRFRTPRRIWF